MYLRCLTHLEPRRWNQWLSLVEWWYNTTHHTAIQITPFEALYGIPLPQLAVGPYLQTRIAAVGDYVRERQQIDSMLKQNLKTGQEMMKKYADESRSERQSSLALRGNTKLTAKYFGPYKVEEKIRNVAHRLQLPTTTKVHPVFHVSLLKRKIGGKVTPTLQLTKIDEKRRWKVEPVAVLDRRIVKRGNAAAVQWLIH
nr:uncharacterized protein LOC113735771 [Coffea arabica]